MDEIGVVVDLIELVGGIVVVVVVVCWQSPSGELQDSV